MQARLTSGALVELTKDCQCITHEGPHWLHMDDIRKAINRQLLDSGNLMGFATVEHERLRDKEQEMTRRGIEAIIR